jgi:hypothetical protein
MLFLPPHEELADHEVAEVLSRAIARGGPFSREADVFLAGVCADHLVEGLRDASLIVAPPAQWRLHD